MRNSRPIAAAVACFAWLPTLQQRYNFGFGFAYFVGNKRLATAMHGP